MNEILRAIEAEQMRNDLPNFRIGDTVKLHVKIKEGNRERIQMFEGTVIKRQNGGLRETFTVRRLAYGVGVERTFPVNSPIIEKMEITRRGKVRRAKLFYLRDRVGKAAKVKELLKVNGASVLLSYIRPIVANLTNSSQYSVLNIPFMDFTQSDSKWST